jgi:hypothetical protein
MVTLDGTIGDGAAGLEAVRGIFAVPRHTWFLRGAAGLALAVAAAGGGVGAGVWLSSHDAAGVAVQATQAHHAPAPIPTKPMLRTPAVPSRAILKVSGQAAGVANWSWVPSPTVTLHVRLSGVGTGVPVHAEAEIEPAGVPFSGVPTASSGAIALSLKQEATQAVILSGLRDATLYHWQVREVAANGRAGGWTVPGVFGVSTNSPYMPRLAATNVHVGGWSTARKVFFRWAPTGSSAPIAGFRYAIVREGVALDTMHPQWTTMSGTVLAVSHWREGRWELLLQTLDAAGRQSPTAVIPFALVYHGPAIPSLVAANPPQAVASNAVTPVIAWRAAPRVVPVSGYQYAAVPGDVATAAGVAWTDTTATSMPLPGLADGSWTVFVRSVNVAGLRSRALRWTFTLDRRVPKLSAPHLSAKTFTEPVQRVVAGLTLDKASKVSFTVFKAGSTTPITTRSLGLRSPGPVSGVNWNGTTTPNHLAPAGKYWMAIDAVDAVGNKTEVKTGVFSLQSKRILISIAKEALWAYDGNKQVYYTLVSNGGPDTPTLPGIFHIEAKVPNMVFHSPWPKGSPLYYAPSPTNYAMLYNADGGYFIHDSPWRSNYGPGSNSLAGQPGGNFTGTHGCTNVPLSTMAELYSWADMGTLIQIVP